MSGTRARTLRGHIVDAIREAPLDQRAGESDRFQHLDTPRTPDSARDRCFRVFVSVPPHLDDTDSGASYRVEFQIELLYTISPEAPDRACDDAERFWWALETFANQSTSVLRDLDVKLSSPAWLGVEVTERLYILRASIVAVYRLDDALIS